METGVIILYLPPILRQTAEDLADLLVIPRKFIIFLIVLIVAPSWLKDEEDE